MGQLTEEKLKEIMNSVLDERDRIDQEVHADHHAWVARRIEADIKSRERWDTFKKSAIGAIAVAVTGAVIKCLAFIGGLIMASSQNGGAIK